MSSRRRPIKSAHVPVNPCYVEHWYGAHTVADAINHAFQAALDRAIRYGGRYGEVTIVMPHHWEQCSASLKAFLNDRLQTLVRFANGAGRTYNCVIHVCDARRTSVYVEMCQSAFHKNEFAQDVFEIPTHWDDAEDDYTWAQLCEDGCVGPTSSTHIWPPPEYKRRAELEKMRNARTARFDPFARYYAAANRN